MDEQKVHDFWQSRTCGDALAGRLTRCFGGDYEKFFAGYDKCGCPVERLGNYPRLKEFTHHNTDGADNLTGWHLRAHRKTADNGPAR